MFIITYLVIIYKASKYALTNEPTKSYKRVRRLKKIGTLKILESVSQLTMQDVRVIISQRSFRK